MRWMNRWRLLWAYLTRQANVRALPVEYIVETTAKCNIYCPMCPRETYKQPKEDMPAAVYEQLLDETRDTAEHMMLIGLGEPLLDRAIFDRIQACDEHGISALISTNGTLLDEAASRQLLATPLEHITLSMDGHSAETYEFYRKGAKFDRVRQNFIRFCQLKQELGARVQVVVQLVAMRGNAHEIPEFTRFWQQVPGVDLVRIKADETDLMEPEAQHAPQDWTHPCHYLWRGPLYVKHNGNVYPCCQSYMLGGEPIGRVGEQPLPAIFNSPEMQRMRRMHIAGRASEIGICARCRTTIPHPLMVAGSLVLHGSWVRKLLPLVERWGKRWMRPVTPPRPESKPELVQIGPPR